VREAATLTKREHPCCTRSQKLTVTTFVRPSPTDPKGINNAAPLIAEVVLQRGFAEAPPEAPAAIVPGIWVTLTGLKGAAHLNGSRGVMLDNDDDEGQGGASEVEGRLLVELDTRGKKSKRVMVKLGNLALINLNQRHSRG